MAVTAARKRNGLRAFGGGDLLREDLVDDRRFGSQIDGAPLRSSATS